MSDYREGQDDAPPKKAAEDIDAQPKEMLDELEEDQEKEIEFETAIMLALNEDGNVVVIHQLEPDGLKRQATPQDAYDLIAKAHDTAQIQRAAQAVRAAIMPDLRLLMQQMGRAIQGKNPIKNGPKNRIPPHARGKRP